MVSHDIISYYPITVGVIKSTQLKIIPAIPAIPYQNAKEGDFEEEEEEEVGDIFHRYNQRRQMKKRFSFPNNS